MAILKKKAKETKGNTVQDLEQQYRETAKNLFNLKNEFQINRKLDKPHLLKKYRKDIARALTAINMKKKNQSESHQ